MKNLSYLNEYKIPHPFAGCGNEHNGAFKIKINGNWFFVIASNGEGWEHVSISRVKGGRCPTWQEMCKIKEMFFKKDEICIQYMMPKDKNINLRENCLHIWRPIDETFPTPPLYCV